MTTTSHQIVIEGDKAKYQEIYTSYEVDLPRFLDALTRPMSSPRLPRDCVFMYSEPGSAYYVIEIAPGLKFVKTHRMRKGIRLSMPWQYFVFHLAPAWDTNTGTGDRMVLNGYYLFWTPEKITNWEEAELYPACVPNVSGDASICFGNTAPDSRMSLADRINTIVNDFYSPDSVFNYDLGENYPPYYSSFRQWALDSYRDNNTWKTWEWSAMGSPRTFAEYLDVSTDKFTRVFVDDGFGIAHPADIWRESKIAALHRAETSPYWDTAIEAIRNNRYATNDDAKRAILNIFRSTQDFPLTDEEKEQLNPIYIEYIEVEKDEDSEETVTVEVEA